LLQILVQNSGYNPIFRGSFQPAGRWSFELTSESKKEVYEKNEGARKPVARLLGVGLISVASALAGGLTVAWWYRKTLAKLQNPITPSPLPEMRTGEEQGKMLTVEDDTDAPDGIPGLQREESWSGDPVDV
jgi:hypothetical protein